jgi:hypothetical protein
MSLFLGKIHYWLYHKIIWSEKTEEEIVRWAEDHNLPAEDWVRQGIEKYGAPTEEKPLEEVIDTSNIHGWLQERIKSAELRQAALITLILAEDPDFKKDLLEIYKKQGEAAALEYGFQPDSPEGMYQAFNDFVLEGMPCDRVNEAIFEDSNEYVWKTNTCIHTPYWDEVKGDVNHFYDLREAWAEAFIKKLNPEFTYEKTDGEHRIVKS